MHNLWPIRSARTSLLGRIFDQQVSNRGKQNTTALDVGANIGNHSLFFSKYFQSVFSFEPSALNYRLLEANLLAREAVNITPIQSALGSINKQLVFSDGHSSKGRSGIIDENNLMRDTLSNQDGVTHEITVENGDEFIRCNCKSNHICFIKVDVEGYELEVFKGLENTIRRFQPLIAFEQLAGEVVNSSTQCIDFLRSLGYHNFYSIEDKPSPKLKTIRISIKLIKGRAVHISPIPSLARKHYPMIIASFHPLNINALNL